jgi:thiol-disulfide isomerase/thioredoxin
MKNSIHKIIVIFVFCSCFYINTSFSQQLKLPELELKDIYDKKIQAQTICDSNDFTVLSFWATWCGPCIKELISIDSIYHDWQKKYNLRLVAVNIDGPQKKSAVIKKIADYNWKYYVILDDNSDFATAMGVSSPPHIFLLNRNGDVIWQHAGYKRGDEVELEKKIIEFQSRK